MRSAQREAGATSDPPDKELTPRSYGRHPLVSPIAEDELDNPAFLTPCSSSFGTPLPACFTTLWA